jgi:chemotaxis protein MotA
MDPTSLIGLLLAIACMVYSVSASGGSLASLVDYPSLAIVFGGALAACMIGFPAKALRQLPRTVARSLRDSAPDLGQLAQTLVRLAETARRDGILALEKRLDEVDDPFLKRGMQLAIDGVRPEMVEEILQNEMDARTARHLEDKSLLTQIGKFCPAFGMIGTLLGLIIMLGQMADPATIGTGMAVALITTLYGLVASNAFILPLAEKLAIQHRAELVAMEITLKGILSIQSGESPRVVEQKLNAFVSLPVAAPAARVRTVRRVAA